MSSSEHAFQVTVLPSGRSFSVSSGEAILAAGMPVRAGDPGTPAGREAFPVLTCLDEPIKKARHELFQGYA